MAPELFPFAVLNLALILYVLTAAVDFGGGVLYITAPEKSRADVRRAVLEYTGPVWETTNVFLVLYVVGMVGFFPRSLAVLVPPLFPWAFLALALLFVRGVVFAYHYQGGIRSETLNTLFAVCGALVPAILVGYIAVIVTGKDPFTAGNTLVMLSLSLLALAGIGYLAASFFAWFATRAGNTMAGGKLAGAGRRYGLASNVLAVVVIIALAIETPAFFARLLGSWPLLLLAMVAAAAAWQLSKRRRFGLATAAAAGQFALGICAVFAAIYPYVVFPTLTAAAALTTGPMYYALTIATIVGLVVILPLLGLLYYLFAFRYPTEPSAHGETSAY